ncbi:MAG TPA: hypothetical protein VMU93_08860 [Caulobacteraceae bacterium]|nr:hypothetical protein [Caulobacteraceae bacterium]
MRKFLLIASVAALAIPGLAMAQPGCHAAKENNRAAGTVLGAGAGALLGGAVTGSGYGALAGAVGGGFVGNSVGGNSVRCGSGYYDSNGAWHESRGYYGPPPYAGGYGPAPNDGNYGPAPYAGNYGANTGFTGGGDLYVRENQAQNNIRGAYESGTITRYDADNAYSMLAGIRSTQAHLRSEHGALTGQDWTYLSDRLDRLNYHLSAATGGNY